MSQRVEGHLPRILRHIVRGISSLPLTSIVFLCSAPYQYAMASVKCRAEDVCAQLEDAHRFTQSVLAIDRFHHMHTRCVSCYNYWDHL